MIPQNLDLFRYFYGPYPDHLCYFNLYVKNVLVLFSMILFSATLVSRYISIFWRKNPLVYLDDFWCCFIVLTAAFICCLAQVPMF
jgi:hypothetical protein